MVGNLNEHSVFLAGYKYRYLRHSYLSFLAAGAIGLGVRQLLG
jgi:hypothetical protein